MCRAAWARGLFSDRVIVHFLSRHPVVAAVLAVVLVLVVITIVKTRQGDWFSFR